MRRSGRFNYRKYFTFSEVCASIYHAGKPLRDDCAAFLAGNLMGRYPGEGVQKGNVRSPSTNVRFMTDATRRTFYLLYLAAHLHFFFFSFYGVSISTSISIRSSSFPGGTTCAKLKCSKIVKSVWKLTIRWETVCRASQFWKISIHFCYGFTGDKNVSKLINASFVSSNDETQDLVESDWGN